MHFIHTLYIFRRILISLLLISRTKHPSNTSIRVRQVSENLQKQVPASTSPDLRMRS